MIENISSNTAAVRSKIRRINLKWILLNQLKLILDELFRICMRVAFSWPAQASFLLICTGDSAGTGYCPHVMPRPASLVEAHINICSLVKYGTLIGKFSFKVDVLSIFRNSKKNSSRAHFQHSYELSICTLL